MMEWLRTWWYTHFTIPPPVETVDELATALVIEGDDPKSLGDDPEKPPPGQRKPPPITRKKKQ